MNKLQDIHLNFKTDKGTGHSYIESYENLFCKFQDKEVNFLEIGVLFGNSLKMWESYFTKAKIYGIDIQVNERLPFDRRRRPPVDWDAVVKDMSTYDRIEFIELDSLDEKVVKKEFDKRKIEFSMIIDDGDHESDSQFTTFCNFVPYLSSDGVYVIEDVGGRDAAQNITESIVQKYEPMGWKPEISIYIGKIETRRDDILIIIESSGSLL